jgi:hypothetical protein
MSMVYWSKSIVKRAGVATDYGGAGTGAVWLYLTDTEGNPPRHDGYFEVKLPWANQALAVALSAITSGKQVYASVGDISDPGEVNPTGEPYCYRIYVTNE